MFWEADSTFGYPRSGWEATGGVWAAGLTVNRWFWCTRLFSPPILWSILYMTHSAYTPKKIEKIHEWLNFTLCKHVHGLDQDVHQWRTNNLVITGRITLCPIKSLYLLGVQCKVNLYRIKVNYLNNINVSDHVNHNLSKPVAGSKWPIDWGWLICMYESVLAHSTSKHVRGESIHTN